MLASVLSSEHSWAAGGRLAFQMYSVESRRRVSRQSPTAFGGVAMKRTFLSRPHGLMSRAVKFTSRSIAFFILVYEGAC